MSLFRITCAACLLLFAGLAQAETPPSSTPKVVPQTRPEMKRLLEALKQRTPRLPLPAVSDEDRASGKASVNNGRMRALYLPAEWTGGGSSSSREPDPSMTLDGTFKTRLFWIVSRANNCHYCMGHQELKLRSAGMADDEVAALDCDWSKFPANEQAALAFTQKITLTPHLMNAADFEQLRKHYTEPQAVEILFTVAGNNSTNRWTDSLGIPQDTAFSNRPADIDTPTSDAYQKIATRVVGAQDEPRPALESADMVLKTLAECRTRKPRIELPSVDAVRPLFPNIAASDPLPQWVRAMALFPKSGVRQVNLLRSVEESGKLAGVLKAQIAWICARQNRAWYSSGIALARLNKLGVTEPNVLALDGDWAGYQPREREVFGFARKLTASPKAITDADIAQLRAHFSDHDVAEIVYVVCVSNMFDRFTETLGLTLE